MTSEGVGSTLSEAQKDADMLLINTLMRSAGVIISGNQIEQIYAINENGSYHETTKLEYKYDFQFDKVHLAFKKVDFYWVKNGNSYDCKVLYEVAYNPQNVIYEPVEYSTKYGARGLWRSAIVPGWGQMYKKSYLKGISLLVAESAMISLSCIYNNQNQSYRQKALISYDPNAIKFYQNKANEARGIRNGLIIGATAIYIYNLIDATLANGKLRYLKSNGQHFALMPWLSTDSSMGMLLSFNF